MATYFSNVIVGSGELKRAAEEGTFAYHLVNHNQSFRSMDCTAGLIRTFYDERFTYAQTKAEAIVTNVIAPHAMDLVKADLEVVQHVSVAVDASNHKAVKMIPIVIRYFKDTEGVQVKILEFTSIPGETSDILVQEISRSLRSFNLMDKVVGFCADNRPKPHGQGQPITH